MTSVCMTLTADPTQSLGYCTNTIVVRSHVCDRDCSLELYGVPAVAGSSPHILALCC